MEFGKAFTFAFEDRDWLKKIGIAGLVMLIPIIGQITVLGWALEIMRRVINHEAELLPDWGAFGEYLVKGLQAFVISLVYTLPVILLNICAQAPSLLMQDPNADEAMLTVAAVAAICFGCLAMILGIGAGLLLPAAFGKFVSTGQLGAAFRFGEVIGLVRTAPGPFLMALLGSIVAGILASLGLILCIIGVIFTSAWAYSIQAHLWGQAYNAATGNHGPATFAGAQSF